jgi:hypothetical protein
VKIPRHNWDTQQLDYLEYPNELFEPFLVWLLTTSAWREDHSRVEQRVIGLERRMADYRNPPDTHHEADAPVSLAAEIKARRVANMAKARAAKRAKQEAVHAP